MLCKHFRVISRRQSKKGNGHCQLKNLNINSGYCKCCKDYKNILNEMMTKNDNASEC